MRITESTLMSRMLASLVTARQESARALAQLADGKKVRNASDDPVGAAGALRLRGDLVRSEGYRQAGEKVRADLGTVDAVLNEAFALLAEARTKAVAGGSTTSDREALALEIDNLRALVLSVSNTSQGGRYLFGGTETTSPPFDDAGTYSGNGEELSVEVDPSTGVRATLDGSRTFSGAGNVFSTLEDLAAALRADDTAGIQTGIADVNAQLDNLNAVRAEVGTRLRLVDTVRVRIEDDQVRIQQQIAAIEDVSLDRAAVELVQAESSLNAVTTATSRALQRSLFDFLG